MPENKAQFLCTPVWDIVKVTGPESTHACEDEQLCTILISGINGVVHGVQYIWDANYTKENWGFLLIDARDAFNEINLIIMLWMVCNLWTSGARFVLNCYSNWS